MRKLSTGTLLRQFNQHPECRTRKYNCCLFVSVQDSKTHRWANPLIPFSSFSPFANEQVSFVRSQTNGQMKNFRLCCSTGGKFVGKV